MCSLQLTNSLLVNTLTKQLSELELLQSMYPSQDEIVISDNNILENINNFLENKTFVVPNYLDFILKLCFDGIKLEIYVNLPSLYPEEEPDVCVRSNQLNRYQESHLNSELSKYIKSIHENEVCLYTVITWLQENINTFKVHDENTIKLPQKPLISKDIPTTFVRIWIFSHHIYCKYKREQIVKKAREFNITGFCLPGKPGIICIEGTDDSCSEWWKDIKSMNWKKICIRKTEVFELTEKDNCQKFTDFQEMNFKNNTAKNNKTGFSSFIADHHLSEEFNDFLGL